MQKHVRIFLSILQNFLAISVDRILSALKTTQLFETEIVWKYVLKGELHLSNSFECKERQLALEWLD